MARAAWSARDPRAGGSRIDAAAGLATDPDFATAYIDGHLTFSLSGEKEPVPQSGSDGGPADSVETDGHVRDPQVSEAPVEDPVLRVRMLPAANHPPVTVNRDDPVEKALLLMTKHDYSQLPVTQDLRRVDGMIIWRSVLLARTLGVEPGRVGECMETHEEVRAEDSLLTAFQKIVDHEAVLVRGDDRSITGIVTATDLSVMFREQTEPLLLLREIGSQLRRLLDGHFPPDELQKNPADEKRKVEDVTDLTFGECVWLLEKPERWRRLGVRLDRKTFVKELTAVRDIRNDVMHFDPDAARPQVQGGAAMR